MSFGVAQGGQIFIGLKMAGCFLLGCQVESSDRAAGPIFGRLGDGRVAFRVWSSGTKGPGPDRLGS